MQTVHKNIKKKTKNKKQKRQKKKKVDTLKTRERQTRYRYIYIYIYIHDNGREMTYRSSVWTLKCWRRFDFLANFFEQ